MATFIEVLDLVVWTIHLGPSGMDYPSEVYTVNINIVFRSALIQMLSLRACMLSEGTVVGFVFKP